MDKEKIVPGPFYIPEYDEQTGDRKFTHASSVLTTTTYNLDPNLHRVETQVRFAAQTRSRDGSLINAPAHFESVKTYRKVGMGCIYCNVCHGTLSYDLGACRKCDIPHDKMLNEARIAMHTRAHGSAPGHYTDEIFGGGPLPSCDEFLRRYLNMFEDNQTQHHNHKRRDDNGTWDLFNNTSDHIFGVDMGAVPAAYTYYIRHTYGSHELGKLETRCVAVHTLSGLSKGVIPVRNQGLS